jgi:hypothetical protein
VVKRDVYCWADVLASDPESLGNPGQKVVKARDYDALMEECTAAMKRNGEYLKALHAADDYWHGPGNTTYGEASDAVRAALSPESPKGG